MATQKELKEEVVKILKTKWQQRAGQKVPEAEDVKLGNDAVTLDGVVLYADMADSTGLVKGFKDWFAAEVFKSYLHVASKIIRDEGGVITSFDGDRVMAVFIGDSKNSSAARAALKINYAVRNIINPALKEEFPTTSFQLQQSVGIDASALFVAKTGIRGANDLVWVGKAANYAAKLCSLRNGDYSSFITEGVYNMLADDCKMGGNPKRSMWEKVNWTEMGITVHRSSWWWAV
jgi:class 3 adenylate cyclase